MTVTRHEIGVKSTETLLNEKLDLTAHFNAGLLRHTLITGVEVDRETAYPTRQLLPHRLPLFSIPIRISS